MGNIIDTITEDFEVMKNCLLGSEEEELPLPTIDLRKKFEPISLQATDFKDAQNLLSDDEVLDVVGTFPIFCTDCDEALFDKLISFVEERELHFVTCINKNDILIYVIRPIE
jgi:hypothetical protein